MVVFYDVYSESRYGYGKRALSAQNCLFNFAEKQVLLVVGDLAMLHNFHIQFLDLRLVLGRAREVEGSPTLFGHIGLCLSQTHLLKALQCSRYNLLEARVQIGDDAHRVETLDTDMQLIDQTSFFQNQVLATDVFNC